ncbi:DUF3105 domain-containing protein [Streptomyces montanisoli]|uniref:DUF3105 domain-containing protein n=1 Tax=Streptomyces montanisoli TaxID=2798581 RepID=A0A940RSS6_9ACTN|nr:DUF3105 domain-containing protein [Streptomyces montanisoli]MBP0456082.1 DUF3105 domain-containing protein [Streptomyces montanisoli]
MGSNSKATKADRRARIQEMRRAEQSRQKRNRLITITASAVILAGLAGGGWYLSHSVNEKNQAKSALIRGEKTWSHLSRTHVQKTVDYPMSPPAGGDHNPVWVPCDAKVYTREVPKEKAVHSLEHGAVWITYTSKASKADVGQLSRKVAKTPYSFMSPYKDQSAPITLTAWGHQIGVNKASDPRVNEFLKKYVQGPQTPEPGASCSAGGMQ